METNMLICGPLQICVTQGSTVFSCIIFHLYIYSFHLFSHSFFQIYLFLPLHWSLWLCRSWQAVENSWRDGNTRPSNLSPEKPVCRVKKQQLEPYMDQLIGSRSRKENDRAVCCHPVCLTCMLSTLWEKPGWMSYKPESGKAGETSTTLDVWMISL